MARLLLLTQAQDRGLTLRDCLAALGLHVDALRLAEWTPRSPASTPYDGLVIDLVGAPAHGLGQLAAAKSAGGGCPLLVVIEPDSDLVLTLQDQGIACFTDSAAENVAGAIAARLAATAANATTETDLPAESGADFDPNKTLSMVPNAGFPVSSPARIPLHRRFAAGLDLLCIMDIDGHVEQVNPAHERLFGSPGRYDTWARGAIRADRAMAQGAIEELRRGAARSVRRLRHSCPGGGTVTVHWELTLAVDGGAIMAVGRPDQAEAPAGVHPEGRPPGREVALRDLRRVLDRDGPDGGIVAALERVARSFALQVAVVWRIGADGVFASASHRWPAWGAGDSSLGGRSRALDAMPWLISRLAHGDAVLANSIADLPAEAEAERRAMALGSMGSWCCLPLRGETGLIGWLELSAARAGSLDDVAVARLGDFTDLLGHHRLLQGPDGGAEECWRAGAMVAVGRASAAVAGRLGNLLAVIQSRTTLAQDAMAQASSAAERLAASDVAAIAMAAKRAGALTEQLCDLARARSRTQELFEIDELLLASRHLLRGLVASHRDLSLVTDAAKAWVRADRLELRQLLIHLILSLRADDRSGGPIVVASRLQAGNPGAAATVELSFTAPNAGDAAGVLRRLRSHLRSDPERQLDDSTAPSSMAIAARMGATIDVIQGAESLEVQLRFAAHAAPASDADAPMALHRRSGRRVLVVEDEPAFRDMVVRTLQRLGFETLAASGGRSALAIAAKAPGGFDLVLTDVFMPDMHGPALVRKLSRDNKPLRTLYMSGFIDAEGLRREVGDPDLALLQKPFRAAELGARIDAMLRDA